MMLACTSDSSESHAGEGARATQSKHNLGSPKE